MPLSTWASVLNAEKVIVKYLRIAAIVLVYLCVGAAAFYWTLQAGLMLDQMNR